MIKKEEIALINKKNYEILRTDHVSVLLRSKITGHIWRIVSQEMVGRQFLVEHKHHSADSFHTQLTTRTIKNALAKIEAHDVTFLEQVRQGKRSQSQLGSTCIHRKRIIE